jgi:hypothetical protein
LRDGDWKLIEHYEDGRLELFHLADDPGEKTDLSAKQPARVAELRGKLETWRRSVNAEGNRANPSFNGTAWRRLYQDLDVSQLPPMEKADMLTEGMQSWRSLMDQVCTVAARAPSSQIPAGTGAVILHAKDAKTHGRALHYEPEPHKDTLGYWKDETDWAEWNFEAPQAGLFEVELLAGCGPGCGGAEIEIAIGDQTLLYKVEETGHFQRFVPRSVGLVTLREAGAQSLLLRAKSKPGAAVMDVRRITLRAAR